MESKIIQDSEKIVIKRIDKVNEKKDTTSSIQISKDNIMVCMNKNHHHS